MDGLLQDVRYGLRTLAKARGFAALAVLTLAAGIGGTTGVFSILNAVLLRPLPVHDADRLFVMFRANLKRSAGEGPFSYAAFLALVQNDRLFSGMAAMTSERFTLAGGERPELLSGGRVSASFLDVLGVPPRVGRGFVSGEDRPGGPNVAVLSRRFWMTHYGGASTAVGGTVKLNGTAFTIVGALATDLPPPYADVEVWTTKVFEYAGLTPQQIDMGAGFLGAVGRLGAAVTVGRAQAELDTIARAYSRDNPTHTDADPESTLQLRAFADESVGTARSTLRRLIAAVGLVLLIACANLANLLLVRAAGRSRESAVRAALGASRGRLIRQLCTEHAILGLAAGFAGLLLATAAIRIGSSTLTNLPRGNEVAIDGRALMFALFVSLATSVLSGLAPAFRSANQSLVEALNGGRGATPDRRRGSAVLVVGEVALSLVLLVGSGLLIRSFVRLIAVPVGFKPEGLIAMSVSLPTPRYIAPGSMAVFFDRLVSRVESIPGVQSAAVSLALPPNRYLLGPYLAEGQPLVDPGRRPVAQWSSISPGYFRTLGVPLLQGRAFTPRDTVLSGRVVIVSQDLARRLWPGADPLGRKLLVARLPDWSEVVGVVGDVKNSGLAHSPEPHMYTPYPQRPWASMQLVVRSAAGDPLRLLGAISASVSSIDPDQPVTDVRTMDAALADSVAETRLVATLLTGFALMALLMAAAGLYGVIAYGVALRTREIGVRVALGAAPRAVLWLVAGDALRLTAAGVVAGTVCAVAASRALRGYLFGVSELDPVTYAAAVTLFGAAAVIAAYVPGWRALKVDPLIALRAD